MGLCTSYLHVRSVWFLTGKKKQNKKTKGRFRKKRLYICFTFHRLINILHLFKRLTSVSGLTEPFPRSAKILYNMYMYFYSYAYKYMSVICLLCPVVFISYLLHKLQPEVCVCVSVWMVCWDLKSWGLKKTAFRACKCEFLFAASQQRRQTFGACFCLFAALLKTLNSLSFLWQKDKTNRQSGGHFTFSKVLLLKTLLF